MPSPRFAAEYQAYLELRTQWNADPERYCVERLGLKPTWQQRQVLEAIAPEGARVSVRSGQNTGKDTVTAGIILWFMECKDHPRIPCTAPTAKQLYTILWAELAKWMRKSVELSKHRGDHPRFYLDKLFALTSDRLYDRSAPQDWFAVARTAAAHAPESLQGFHASDLEIDASGLAVAQEGEANMLVVLDEASGIADSINQVLDGALASPGARELQIGNPNRNTGFFAMTHKHMGALYTLRHFKSAESPLCDPKFRPRMVTKFGEDSDVVRVRCDGEFPKAEADTLIPLEYADAALKRQLPELMSAQPLKLGIDCAWTGEDRTAYALRRGSVIPYLETGAKTEPMEIVGRAVQLIREWHVDEVFVDTIGIGAGVYSRLCELRRERQIDCRISAVNVQELAPKRQFDSDTQTHLLRDYLWWECRRFFRDDQPVITAESDLASDLVGEVSSIKQLPPDSKGYVRVEPKEAMKKRLGGRSPDLGDALCVTFAPVSDQPYRYEAVGTSTKDFKRKGLW